MWITEGLLFLPTQVGTVSIGIMDCSTSDSFMHGRLAGFRRSEACVDGVVIVAQVVVVDDRRINCRWLLWAWDAWLWMIGGSIGCRDVESSRSVEGTPGDGRRL